MGCSGCNCEPPDPMTGTRERWRSLLFLVALGGVLLAFASRLRRRNKGAESGVTAG